MDIKDFILIGGGLLIAVVVAHGFWIAWRSRRDPLRIDIVTDLPDEPVDDLRRLRSELPNGGARVVARDADVDALPEQADLPLVDDDDDPLPAPRAARQEPRLGAAAAAAPARQEPAAPQRSKVADVIMPERGGKAEEPKQPRRFASRKGSEASERPASPAASGRDGRRAEQAVEELIVINVIAPKGKPFVGGGMVEALRARGLKYGDMNIFHRVDPISRSTLYSVANVVEPGTFDMADLDNFRSPGVCFFMQLPGPEAPLEAFEDMLKVTREVAMRLGGELKDEQRSVMTGQTVEHYRQRIVEFCRRRMSMRA